MVSGGRSISIMSRTTPSRTSLAYTRSLRRQSRWLCTVVDGSCSDCFRTLRLINRVRHYVEGPASAKLAETIALAYGPESDRQDANTGPEPKEELSVTERFAVLEESELEETVGGDWSWGSFASGLSWSLGLGCFVSANPVLCGGALITSGISYYF